MRRVRSLWVSLVVLAAAALSWQCVPVTAETEQAGKAYVDVEMEIYGGFAFIREARKLNVVSLISTNRPADMCVIEQLGTDLFVVSGDIVDVAPARPVPTRRFELVGATVTFPGLETASGNLSARRDGRLTGRPTPHDQESRWRDLRWVAGISSGESGSDFPKSSLRPDWQTRAESRVELVRGRVDGTHPSDYAIQQAQFDFRSVNAANPAQMQTHFSHAITDRVIWTVRVPTPAVEIALAGARSGVSRIVVQPTKANRKVKLRLIGRHAHGTVIGLTEGQKLDHFCAFYDLMPDATRPVADRQILPFVKGLPPPDAGAPSGRPSPGAYCPPDWP